MGKRDRANYSALDAMQRLETIEDAAGGNQGDIDRMQSSTNSRQMRQDNDKNTNPDRRLSETARRKIERHHTCTGQGRDENLELLNETRYGRLLVNPEMHPCLKRACLSLEAIHLIGIGKMQIQWQEQKKLIESTGKSNGQEKVELYNGKIEGLLEKAENDAGLTRPQFK